MSSSARQLIHAVARTQQTKWHGTLESHPSTVAAFKDQLASYKVSKGTIRFPVSEPVPVKLIERIAKFRAEEAVPREQY
jgi:uncharacterized protein YdhG (YjbR/CyaY superfamily)